MEDLIEIKHGFAFKGKYISVVPNENILLTPGNFAIGGGFRYGKGKYYTGPIPDEYILKSGDLIVTMTDLSKFGDTLGYSAKVPTNKHARFLHNQRIGLVTLISNYADGEYLYWLMRTREYQKYIVNRASGSSVKHTSPSTIKSYCFTLPSPPEQRAIAATLSCLDDKIELNNKINTNLEQQAQAFFKSWFVDFEPFQDGEFVDSELGPIPKGWRVGTLSEIGEVVGGATPSKAKGEYYAQSGTGISWITPKDLSRDRSKYISCGEVDITESGYDASSTRIMPKGTVLFSSRAPIGYIAIADRDVCTNQGFKSVIPNNDFGTEFVYWTLKHNLEAIEGLGSGSTFKEVSGTVMKSVKVLIPQKSVVREFCSLCKPLFSCQRTNEFQSRTLATLRDTLLPKLMSGEIEIPT